MISLNFLSTESRRALEYMPSDTINAYVLVANTAQTVTVPTGATIAAFSANGNFYVNWTTTATVPAANVTSGLASELNPTTRRTLGGTTFSIIAPIATIVTIAYYN